MNKINKILFKGLAVAIILFAAWRMLATGLAEHYVELALDGEIDAIDKALSWNSDHPRALYLKADAISGTEPEKAEALLQESIYQNPADARSLALLGQLLYRKGDLERSDYLMEKAEQLMPANQWNRLAIADYWLKREKLDKAIDNWSAAMVTRPNLRKDIFPVLLKVAEQEALRPNLQPLTDNPPSWWDAFFAYLASKALHIDTVEAVNLMRHGSATEISMDERKALVGRLKKDQLWPEAYLAWVNGLDREEQRHLGSVFNGGFELPLRREGFGWYAPQKLDGVEIRRQHTYGIGGERALHLIFKGREMRFHHLYQPLFLAPGEYVFRANVRPDRLNGRGGLQWRVECAGSPRVTLGESGRFLGTSEWARADIQFTVPADNSCPGQVLRLVSTGRTTYDHKLEGEIWLDQVAIRRIKD